MTTELVLLLGIYGFIVLGVFLGDLGPIETFKRSTPRLAARIERNLSVGHGFNQAGDGHPVVFVGPQDNGGGSQ